MEKFAKSILNYFATYTETRFSFRKRIDYKWSDDHLTAELSVYSDFQKKVLNTIKNKEPFQLSVKKGEYSIVLSEDSFQKELLQKLNTDYNLNFLQSCLQQVREKLIETESDKLIIAGADKADKLKEKIVSNPDFEKKVLSQGIRKFNLAFRTAVQDALLKLQKEKREELLRQFNLSNAPLTSFNPNNIEQEIFNLMQEKSHQAQDGETYFNDIKNVISDKSWDLEMYDLYATIRKFTTVLTMGTPYMFFHEISFIDNKDFPYKYPVFLIELDIDEKNEEVVLKCNRNVLLINTPAINSFGFSNILTTPRAARIIEANDYLFNVERFLQNSYDFYESFLLEYAFKTLAATNCPDINYRIGLQCIQKENRKLLDYSELITRIDAGQGGKFIGFVKDYVSGNVKNTSDEVDKEYKTKYPKKSVRNIISSIPMSLNKAQKRIITALENPKNKVVVIDGPPGTGKSYTIVAITYWANMQGKTLVITSHKKAALDVLDRMLTDKFKTLHPKAKPSVMRVSQDESGINTIQNSLSGPVISAANNRVNSFNEEAVKKDIEKWEKAIDQQASDYWNNSTSYQDNIQKLFRYSQLEDDLKQEGIIKADTVIPKLPKDKPLSIPLVKECMEQVEKSNIDDISINQLTALYEHRDSIEKILAACNTLRGHVFNFSV